MYIVKNKKTLAEDIFDGRNSEWFNNLQKDGWDDTYNKLPSKYGFSEQCPDNITKNYKDEFGFYGFHYINVGDFREWFIKYRPDIDAGWVSTYDKWRIENKEYVPEDLQHYLDKDDNINDMHFVTVQNKYDCSKWLYEYLNEYNIPNDADIWYCFDR